MKKLAFLGSVFAVVALSALVVPVGAAEGETPTIKKIMAVNKAPLNQLKAQLKSDSPDWTAIKKIAKEFNTLGAALPKTEAPKGDQAAYVKLAEAFAKCSKDLDAAATKEDLAAVKAACTKISTSCMTCHKAHKGK